MTHVVAGQEQRRRFIFLPWRSTEQHVGKGPSPPPPGWWALHVSRTIHREKGGPSAHSVFIVWACTQALWRMWAGSQSLCHYGNQTSAPWRSPKSPLTPPEPQTQPACHRLTNQPTLSNIDMKVTSKVTTNPDSPHIFVASFKPQLLRSVEKPLGTHMDSSKG